MKFYKITKIKVKKQISFFEAREYLTWTTAAGRKVLLCEMHDNHLEVVRKYLKNYKFKSKRNKRWLKIFKLELKFRKYSRSILSLSSLK